MSRVNLPWGNEWSWNGTGTPFPKWRLPLSASAKRPGTRTGNGGAGTACPGAPSVELAGGYVHIQLAPAILQPGHNDRDTRVEVTKIP